MKWMPVEALEREARGRARRRRRGRSEGGSSARPAPRRCRRASRPARRAGDRSGRPAARPRGSTSGELPSQQPPDWKSISLPCLAVRRSIAVERRVGRDDPVGHRRSSAQKKPSGFGVVADEQALGLRVVVEHHLVVLAPDAGDLVAAEGGVGRVLVVAVGPHAAGLDRAAHAVRPAVSRVQTPAPRP